jgi:hypothetical protein
MVSMQRPGGAGASANQLLYMATADIASLQQERFSLERTLGLALDVPAAGLGLTYLIVCGEGQCQPDY